MPTDYHLLIENDHTISLDCSEKINYSRPCIDVTFQTAAEAYKKSLACILLSGASSDGVEGLELVKTMGGITAVQNPETAEVAYMPQKALEKMNDKSKNPEKLEPQDSKKKEIKHPQNDNEAVVKPADRSYTKEDVDFGNTAQKRENSEQPANPIRKEPKE